MTPLTPQTRIKRTDEGLLYRSIDDETIIVRLDGSGDHVLNPVGSTIWELADGTKTIAEMATVVCELCEDVTLDVVLQDTLELVKQLLDSDLAAVVEDEPE